VGTEQGNLTGDGRRLPASFLFGASWFFVPQSAEIAVAEPVLAELRPGDGLQEFGVLGTENVQCAKSLGLGAPLAIPTRPARTADGLTQGRGQLLERLLVGEGRLGFHETFVGGLRDFGPTFQVGDPFAQRQPLSRAFRFPFLASKDLEVPGVVHGHLETQVQVLVVDLQRVAVEAYLHRERIPSGCNLWIASECAV